MQADVRELFFPRGLIFIIIFTIIQFSAVIGTVVALEYLNRSKESSPFAKINSIGQYFSPNR